MNYRDKIRKSIECPQFGNSSYGEWGALRIEQRRNIKRLLDELDSADNYIVKMYKENKQLKEQLQNISNEFLKYDWKTSNKEQIINQLESLYNSIFRE